MKMRRVGGMVVGDRTSKLLTTSTNMEERLIKQSRENCRMRMSKDFVVILRIELNRRKLFDAIMNQNNKIDEF